MTILDETKPLPKEIYVYTCATCEDSAIYLELEAARYQCSKHSWKSFDCMQKNMRIAHYKKVQDCET